MVDFSHREIAEKARGGLFSNRPDVGGTVRRHDFVSQCQKSLVGDDAELTGVPSRPRRSIEAGANARVA